MNPKQKTEWTEIGTAAILSAVTWGYYAITFLIVQVVKDPDILYTIAKTRSIAVVGWIMAMASLFLNAVSPSDLFDMDNGNGTAKAILLVGLWYCIAITWPYG